MRIVTLDFETYYSKDFSLSKLTTEEYIRSPEFEVIGVSVKSVGPPYINTSISEYIPADWFSGTLAETKEFLDSYNMEDCVVVGHNAMFDMAILNWHFDIRPKKIVDTLSMSRTLLSIDVGGSLAALAKHFNLGTKGTEIVNALGKRRIDFNAAQLAAYGGYCVNDTELTYALFLRLAEGFPRLELDLIDLTMRMFTEPALVIDENILTDHLEGIVEKKDSLMAAISQDKKMLMSNPKFAEILEKLGVVPPRKISLTTGKETFAFAKSDEGMKALLEHENPKVQLIAAARVGVKSTLDETRTQRLINVAKRGLLPIPLRYYAAHTGRWGGADKINMQNLPRGSAIKYALTAPEGYSFVDCDLSQIEARVLAWLAGQLDLVEAFDLGKDVYKLMASKIYGVPVEEITKAQRFVGKQTILGCGYGMGPDKFKTQLAVFNTELELDECKRIIQVYRSSNPAIPALWKQAGRALDAMIANSTAPIGLDGVIVVEGTRGIKLPNGLYLKYPNLRKELNTDTGYDEYVYDTKLGRTTKEVRIYGGKMIENICQALARIVIGEQLVATSKKYKVVMTVHDAIGSLVPTPELAEARAWIEAVMKVRPEWAAGLPLDCESGIGQSYGECGEED